jgi:hypothetical protein
MEDVVALGQHSEIEALADAILALVREIKKEHPEANAFEEDLFCEELEERPDRVAKAFDLLAVRGRAERVVAGTWRVHV